MQSSQRGFWRLVQYPQQRLCSACRAAFALLPVADRIQRNVNALGKLRLAETQTPAYATRKLSGIQHCLGVIGGFVLGDIPLIRCIDATNEGDIAKHKAADDAEAVLDAAKFARRVRWRLGFSQAEFAKSIDVSLDTIRNWEQGKRSPTGAAKALLRVLDKAPEAALAALH